MVDGKKIIYLDYNASAPIDERVLEYMFEVYKTYPGNADSRTHEYGTSAKQIVSSSRSTICDILGITDTELIFTSGSTESNNLAVLGLYEHAKKTGRTHFITTSIEHKSVLEAMKRLQSMGCEVDFVAPDASGRVQAADILSRVKDTTLLVSVMHINSETGIIQPVCEIGEALSKTNIYFHVDATQSFGKLNEDIRRMKYDLLSFTAHKFGGPQGRGIRPGTTPVALVAGMAKAAELSDLECSKTMESCKAIKERLIQQLTGLIYHINGDPQHCIPNTINISFEGIDAESLFVALKSLFALSNGSACNSGSFTPSYVLTEMGLSTQRIGEAVRISWSATEDIDFSSLADCIRQLQ